MADSTLIIAISDNKHVQPAMLEQRTEAMLADLSHFKNSAILEYPAQGDIRILPIPPLSEQHQAPFWQDICRVLLHSSATTEFVDEQTAYLHLDPLFTQTVAAELRPGTTSVMLLVSNAISQKMIKTLRDYQAHVFYTPIESL